MFPLSLKKNFNFFTIDLMILIIVGIVMVFSSSYLFSKEHFGEVAFLLKKQTFFLVVGISMILVLRQIPVQFYFQYRNYYIIPLLIILSCTLLPQVGINLKGAKRWIGYGPFYLQPGEFIKYAMIPLAIDFFENFQIVEWRKKLLPGGLLLLPFVIFAFQPDFGALTIYGLILGYIAFLTDFPRKLFYGSLVLSVSSLILMIFLAPYRLQRVLTFLDPWKDPRSSGFQIIQSYLAFANGHIFGRGLGNSQEKLFYLPEAHNDFILSVIGEELGLLGIVIVILLTIGLLYFGLGIALKIKNKMTSQLITTLIFTISIQAVLNMAVVLGLVPTKGLNFPFISYGGSSLLANCFAIGLIFSSVRGNIQSN